MTTFNTNPTNADSDDDGLTDGYEVNTSLTDPTNADSDDGLTDGYEVNTSLTNPSVADSDDDGLTDGYEVNTSSTDPTDTDTDEDGLSDGEEIIGIISVANNNYYELIEGSFTWHAARDDAISKGGHLATITSSNEWSIVDAIIVGDVWLGATDENSEGQWEWITGEAGMIR